MAFSKLHSISYDAHKRVSPDRSDKISLLIVSVVTAFLVGCAAQAPTSIVYEDWSVSKLIMLKPEGNYVRVTAPWVGPVSHLALVPDDCFASFINDPKSTASYILWIPKSLADDASKYAMGSTITVEGEAQKVGARGVLAGIRVHRILSNTVVPK